MNFSVERKELRSSVEQNPESWKKAVGSFREKARVISEKVKEAVSTNKSLVFEENDSRQAALFHGFKISDSTQDSDSLKANLQQGRKDLILELVMHADPSLSEEATVDAVMFLDEHKCANGPEQAFIPPRLDKFLQKIADGKIKTEERKEAIYWQRLRDLIQLCPSSREEILKGCKKHKPDESIYVASLGIIFPQEQHRKVFKNHITFSVEKICKEMESIRDPCSFYQDLYLNLRNWKEAYDKRNSLPAFESDPVREYKEYFNKFLKDVYGPFCIGISIDACSWVINSVDALPIQNPTTVLALAESILKKIEEATHYDESDRWGAFQRFVNDHSDGLKKLIGKYRSELFDPAKAAISKGEQLPENFHRRLINLFFPPWKKTMNPDMLNDLKAYHYVCFKTKFRSDISPQETLGLVEEVLQKIEMIINPVELPPKVSVASKPVPQVPAEPKVAEAPELTPQVPAEPKVSKAPELTPQVPVEPKVSEAPELTPQVPAEPKVSEAPESKLSVPKAQDPWYVRLMNNPWGLVKSLFSRFGDWISSLFTSKK